MTRYAHVFRLFTAPFIAAALMLFLLPIRCFAVTQEELENIEAQREVLETRRDNIEKKVSDLSASHASALEQKAALDERNQITLKQIKLLMDQIDLCDTMKTLSVAAVLAVVIISGSVTASAFGYNLWGAVAEWTRDTFGFTQGQNNGIYPFENLRDALAAYDINDPIVPQWIPDGYGEDTVQAAETPDGKIIVAVSKQSGKEIKLEVKIFNDPSDQHWVYEMFEDGVEKYASNGIDFYIMKNDDFTRVSWAVGNNECSILCALEPKEIDRMIDSIF